MGRRGRPTVAIALTDDERETLQRWARRHSSSQALALRCRIVLDAGDGLTNTTIAQRRGCHAVTVSKWRHRFAADRLWRGWSTRHARARGGPLPITSWRRWWSTPRDRTEGCDALVDARVGRQARDLQDHRG